MICTIYFLSPTKVLNSFPEKCSVKTKCTRVADYNNRGYGLKPIETKESIEKYNPKSSVKILKDPYSLTGSAGIIAVPTINQCEKSCFIFTSGTFIFFRLIHHSYSN